LNDGFGNRHIFIPADVQAAIDEKAFGLAFESMKYFREHVTTRVKDQTPGTASTAQLTPSVVDELNGITLGNALAYKLHTELSWVAQQASSMRRMASDVEAKAKENMTAYHALGKKSRWEDNFSY
jgi:hypothetical protein